MIVRKAVASRPTYNLEHVSSDRVCLRDLEKDTTVIQGTESRTETEMSVDLNQLLQTLIEDRQSWEKELAEERRRREEELKRREEELLEERTKREEEARERDRQLREQYQLLRELMEARAPSGREAEAKVSKLTEKDDIEAYFERLMIAYEVRKERWSFKLAPQLIGKAQQAYSAMGADEAADYDQLKAEILRRYGINEENYCQRFWQAKKKQDETNKEFGIRLRDLVNKWMEDCMNNVDLVKDRVVMEQLIDTLPTVREHKPKSSQEAGELADDYVQARGSGLEIPGHQRLCHTCGKAGHLMKDCPVKAEKNEKPKKNVREIECYNCRKKGHYSLIMRCSVDHPGIHVCVPWVPGSMESLVQDWLKEGQYPISFWTQEVQGHSFVET